jgi:pyrroline-5-carboxylate reductase
MAAYKYGFIGAGNMGGALAAAAARAVGGKNVFISDRSAEKAAALAEDCGASVSDNESLALSCDYVFLGVKPQVLGSVLSELAPTLKSRGENYTLVSMAAGCTIASVRAMLGFDAPVIRIMPNTPVSVGEGMIFYDFSDGVTKKNVSGFLSSMARAGQLDRLDEKLIDAGCAVASCGPAFVDLFIEALSDGGVECGLPRDKALLYAEQMVYGSAKLALESGKHPAQLKDAVCSPGGSTIAGVRALEESGFRAAAMDAVLEAFAKTVALGKK